MWWTVVGFEGGANADTDGMVPLMPVEVMAAKAIAATAVAR